MNPLCLIEEHRHRQRVISIAGVDPKLLLKLTAVYGQWCFE